MNRKRTHIFFFSVSVSILLAALAFQTHAAFQGPPAGANPPTGGGLMGVDPNRNIQLFDIQAGSANATPAGALDGAAFGRVFMITADNNPGIGVKDISAGRGYVLTARNDGTLALWDDVARAVRLYVDTSGNIAVGSTDPALAKLHVFGNIRTEGSFIGGRMQAAYLASDVFGDFTGGGNYAFPAALGIGVSSIGGLPANGLYVAGSVGIGATPPSWSKLAVNGDIVFTSQGSWTGYAVLTSEAAGVPLVLKARGGANPDLVIATNGNVGIGTASPANNRLVVVGTNGIRLGNADEGNNNRIYLGAYDNTYIGQSYQAANQYYVDFVHFTGNGAFAENSRGFRFIDASNGAVRLFINDRGNVGIGTASPGDRLAIASGAISLAGNCDDEANYKVKNGQLILQWSGGGNCGYPPNRMGLMMQNAELANAVALPSGALDTANTTYALQSPFAGYPANRIKIRNGDFAFGYKAGSATASFTEADWQDRLFIAGTTGNVGIGTTAPTTKLHVAGDVKVEGDVIANNTGAATEISAAQVSQGTFGSLSTKGNYKFEGAANTNPVLFIDATNEKVGIGTASPGYTLDVNGGIRAGAAGYYSPTDNLNIYSGTVKVIAAGGGSTIIGSNFFGGAIDFIGTGGTLLRINAATGNVGIGTTDPKDILHVKKSTDVNLAVGGAVALTGAVSVNAINDAGTANTPLEIRSSETMFSAGNVAIGNMARTYALNVNGIIYTPGNLYAGGNVGIGTTAPQHALDIQGAYYSRMVVRGNVSGAVTIDWNEGNVQHITLAGNVTLTFTNGQSGGRYVLVVKQDAIGGRTVTWPTNSRFPGGATFNITPTAGRSDYLGFLYNGVDSKYDNVAFSAAFF